MHVPRMNFKDCHVAVWNSPLLGFARLCQKKKHIMLLAVLIFFRNNAKIMLLSENYALRHRNYATWILRKIKITSSLALSSLTLMNIHIVHLPVLQHRKYARAHLEKPNDLQIISKLNVFGF